MISKNIGLDCRHGRFEKKGKFLLVVSLTLVLIISSGSFLTSNVLGHVTGKTLQGWAPTPPSIDGDIVASEWQTAASSTFSLTIGGNPYAGTLYIMNDATNLYLAVAIADPTFSPDPTPDAVAFYFDNNHNGIYQPGEDSVAQYSGVTGFRDRFLQAIPTMGIDVALGGTTDGSGACAAHAGNNHFEISHPLNSFDDAHDFSLGPLSTVGFTMGYADAAVGQDYWPAIATENTTTWGDIVIASAPQTMMAWASTPPTIDGVLGATEWTGAAHTSFSIGWSFVGDLWVMNDATNLYVAVKIADTSLTTMDRLYIAFDNNNNGVREAGDDILGVMGDGEFMDLFWGPTTKFDNFEAGSSDGEGKSSGSGGFNSFEISHPLNTADNVHDFSLTAGDTVGFDLEYWEEATGYWGDWPSLNARSWAHIIVASASVPTPDFALACAPSPLSLTQGGSGTSTCTVTSLNAFSAAVGLSGSWVGAAPSGVTQALPTPITPTSGGNATSILTVTTAASSSTGSFTFRVTGTSDALTHAVDIPVQINSGASDFTITVSPASLSLGPAASGTTTITVQSIGTFSAPVTLTGSGLSGLNLALGTNPVIPPAGGIAQAVLTITVAGAPIGSHSVTITGASGALGHSTTLTVEVTGTGGGCLIATATYGSELSDEVQFLRGFRDNSIMKTTSGSSFMIAFNAWYYSFSPTFAQFIREHSTARTIAKATLYPLMGILRLGAATFQVSPANPEAGAVLSGLLVSSLIGVVYLAPPLAIALVFSSRLRRIAKKLQLPIMMILFSTMMVVSFVMIVGAPGILTMLATSAIVLSSLIASGLFASHAILRAVKDPK